MIVLHGVLQTQITVLTEESVVECEVEGELSLLILALDEVEQPGSSRQILE
jgi:hypothetical protein